MSEPTKEQQREQQIRILCKFKCDVSTPCRLVSTGEYLPCPSLETVIALIEPVQPATEGQKENTDGLKNWRRDFLKLPMSERRRLLAEQAELLRDLYHDSDAREWTEATDGGC